jgi:hypothetical protein
VILGVPFSHQDLGQADADQDDHSPEEKKPGPPVEVLGQVARKRREGHGAKADSHGGHPHGEAFFPVEPLSHGGASDDDSDPRRTEPAQETVGKIEFEGRPDQPRQMKRSP